MAKRTLQAWSVALFLLAALSLLLFGDRARTAQQPVPIPGRPAPTPQPPGHESLDSGTTSSGGRNIENRPFLNGGEMDYGNHFATTVMVATEDPSKAARAPRCSGIILRPRMVLTAAHCVCHPKRALNNVKQLLTDASACAPRAFATSVIYGAVLDADWKEGTTEMSFKAHEGDVRVHPEFELRTDIHGNPLSSRADLALIVLDAPVKETTGTIRLASREVRPGENLIMTGYTQDDSRLSSGLYGIRYMRRHKVIKTLPSSEGRVLYDRPDPHVILGFAGGPCLGEDEEGPWLMGIATLDSRDEMSCTSVYAFQDWLRAEFMKTEH